MSTVRVTAFVPIASLAVVEAAIEPYLLGPGAIFRVPLVPLAGADSATATHYGTCAAISDTGETFAALPAIKAAIPEAEYAVVSPWRSFNHQTHWLDWLAGFGLKPRRQS